MGLQRQDHGPSVQEAVERAAFEVTGETVTMHSAGRTDSGVHALGMVSHVEIAKPFTPFRLMEALNARLRPDPIAVLACEAEGRRLARALLVHRPPLPLPHPQPPRAADARQRQGVARRPARSTPRRCSARRAGARRTP